MRQVKITDYQERLSHKPTTKVVTEDYFRFEMWHPMCDRFALLEDLVKCWNYRQENNTGLECRASLMG